LNAAMMANPERRTAALERIPLGRFGTPEEMARIALFLASPLASYVVGQTLLADGGMLL
jgi:3-oxoacyl-[acyl-carrier protein] reductase